MSGWVRRYISMDACMDVQIGKITLAVVGKDWTEWGQEG